MLVISQYFLRWPSPPVPHRTDRFCTICTTLYKCTVLSNFYCTVSTEYKKGGGSPGVGEKMKSNPLFDLCVCVL